MPIKNYTSKMPVSQSLSQIQDNLIAHGVQGFMTEYEPGTGRISSMKFVIDIKGKKVGFAMPVNWRLFQAVLKKDQVKRWDEEDYCYRVAWANIRDWIDSQMALIETQMIELPQIFLPFAMDKSGKTLYEQVSNGSFLLGDGK